VSQPKWRCHAAMQRRCVTASPQVVEAGNRIADEQADRLNNGLDGRICRSTSVSNRPTASAC
jgi:hypothetical protein